ncbi:MAG: hypothetical protein IT426_19600 [Pirellulales bacterium]|nr:hypothetical protein [Pirellulales bacterium]
MALITQPFAVIHAGILILLSILPAGCGDGRPRRVPVSGRVSIDGQPLTAGFIQVFPVKDRAASGPIGPDGRFTLSTFDQDDGCVLGKHRVLVIGSEHQSAYVVKWLAPKKYSAVNTSGLWVEIAGPTDNLEIKLTWDGGIPFVEDLNQGGGDEGVRPGKRPGTR